MEFSHSWKENSHDILRMDLHISLSESAFIFCIVSVSVTKVTVSMKAWSVHGVYMGCAWGVHGVYMGCAWGVHG